MRRLTIPPGGVIPTHEHNDRPSLVYFIKGEVSSTTANAPCRSSTAPANSDTEWGDYRHWWENKTDSDVVLIGVDIVPPDFLDDPKTDEPNSTVALPSKSMVPRDHALLFAGAFVLRRALLSGGADLEAEGGEQRPRGASDDARCRRRRRSSRGGRRPGRARRCRRGRRGNSRRDRCRSPTPRSPRRGAADEAGRGRLGEERADADQHEAERARAGEAGQQQQRQARSRRRASAPQKVGRVPKRRDRAGRRAASSRSTAGRRNRRSPSCIVPSAKGWRTSTKFT